MQKIKLGIGILLVFPLFLTSGVNGMGLAVLLTPILTLFIAPPVIIAGCIYYNKNKTEFSSSKVKESAVWRKSEDQVSGEETAVFVSGAEVV